MEANVKLARKMHLLKVDSADIIDVENVSRFAPGEVCVVCTGSQGEPLAVLSRLSRGDARNFKVGADDTIILSSHPIPGNEWSVGRVIDDLHREATEVIDSSQEPSSRLGSRAPGRTTHLPTDCCDRRTLCRCTASIGTWSITPTRPVSMGLNPATC